MVKDERREPPLRSKTPSSAGHPLKGNCRTTSFSLGPKPQGVCPRTVPAEAAQESATSRSRKRNELQKDVNGVGQPARAKEKAWDALLGKTKRKGAGRGDDKLANGLAKVNPGSWRLLIRIHSTSAGQISEPAAREPGGGGLPAAGEKFRTEAGRPVSQKGGRWGNEFVGFQRSKPKQM